MIKVDFKKNKKNYTKELKNEKMRDMNGQQI